MKKNLVSISAVFILICVGLSGCNELDEKNNSESPIAVIIEAAAQVVNSTGEPVEGVSVSFMFGHIDLTTKIVHHTTDSTGWTGFAVDSISIKKDESAFCSVYLTDNNSVHENREVHYSDVKNKVVDNTYYLSFNAKLVQV